MYKIKTTNKFEKDFAKCAKRNLDLAEMGLGQGVRGWEHREQQREKGTPFGTQLLTFNF